MSNISVGHPRRCGPPRPESMYGADGHFGHGTLVTIQVACEFDPSFCEDVAGPVLGRDHLERVHCCDTSLGVQLIFSGFDPIGRGNDRVELRCAAQRYRRTYILRILPGGRIFGDVISLSTHLIGKQAGTQAVLSYLVTNLASRMLRNSHACLGSAIVQQSPLTLVSFIFCATR